MAHPVVEMALAGYLDSESIGFVDRTPVRVGVSLPLAQRTGGNRGQG
ncbi:hypothetical protein [Chamaesiphon minutus]|uniref:Uncharacterized protein n=1 Tax=Chamaesiphon minutus (strain ATCC 27169 / PCC 6605) TaxID=1173020 RepID=K9UM16_CHAP6|nr:hypothetical protein [Chamaesiphon minutus]AFY96157.1 hypothetical protein Cha6605_5269 [Chamaesiphon minutus PCC 6605]